ncbi:MAG TPA: fibronectin type III domain-containing protein [Amnibacterium sp.]|nr:fibronectin type III domain-containing protein [Amnibacterium sp.]
MHRHTIAVAMATAAAVGAFALLPLTAAFADDVPQAGPTLTDPSSASDDASDDQGTTSVAAIDQVKVRPLDSDRVQVAWRLDDGDATTITGYQVVLTSDVGGTLSTTVTDPALRSVIVATLAPDTRYRATVTPLLAGGTGVAVTSGWTHTDRSRLGKAAEQADRDAKAAARAADRLAKDAARAADRAQQAAKHAAKQAEHTAKAAARAAAKQAADVAKRAARAEHMATELQHRAHDAAAKAAREREADQHDEAPGSA